MVTKLMMHGPCGAVNPGAACTENKACNKHFPKKYNEKTFFNSNGHTHYRRRQTEVHIMKGESRLDNCNVVPYNRMLCLAFHAHINVENYGWSMLIKYLFKYISKGPDRILAKINRPIGDASTSMGKKHIQVDEIQNYIDGHFLENMQRVNFRERDRLDIIVNMPDKKKTTLTECWHQRLVRTKKSLGRLTYVHPNSDDLFYFWLLLGACEALDPPKLWRKHWTSMQDDIPANVSEATGILNYHVNTHELQDYILYELEAILNGFGKSVTEFRLPPPPERLLKDLNNKLLMEEINYKRDLLMQDAAHFVPKLNHDQKEIYNLIINASEESRQELLFVYGHGVIGKTFLWKTTISLLRFKLPLDLTDEYVCHAKKHSQLANLLVETDLIIWDEAPMNDRLCFEALDRTLRDLRNASEIIFGGKTVVLGGDFRQTLPVKKGVAKEELIHASIAESYLWLHFKIGTLKENMRLLRSGLGNEERERSEEKAIVCPKKDTADAVNAKILSSIEAKGVITNYDASKCKPVRRLMQRSSTKMSETTIASLKVGQENCILEAKVYRRWISKSIPEMKQLAFCCILIDRENNAIHANMDVNNINYFDPLLKPRTAYRILNFICEKTKPYQQTLENKIIHSIQLAAIKSFLPRRRLKNDISDTDSDITPSGNANTGQKYQRKVDIKNLDGNVVEFTMWDDLAKHFMKEEIEKLPRLVIIAVSSCRVSKYKVVSTGNNAYAEDVKIQKAS
ncbi:DNA helicase [Tanacetum coccineum]